MDIRFPLRTAAPVFLSAMALVAIASCAKPAPATPTISIATQTVTGAAAPANPSAATRATPTVLAATPPSTPAASPSAATAAPSPPTPMATPAASAVAASATPVASTAAMTPAATTPAAATTPSVASTGATSVTTTPISGQDMGAAETSGTPVVAGTPVASAAGQAIQAVILKSNLAQSAAFASGDPTAMKPYGTSDFYNQMVQSNQQLAGAGATSVKLIQLAWGPVAVQGTSAQATTFETWLTGYNTGQTELQESDENVYDLVQSNGQWLIQADNHPNDQNASGSSGPVRRRPAPTPPGTPPAVVTPSTDTSRNWAGYSATGGQFTEVTGTWIVPHVNALGATSISTDATWVGIGGVTNRDLIQSGSEAEVVGPGDVVYDTWIEMLPAPPTVVPLAIVPGDSLTVTIAQSQGGAWSISLKDGTTGKTFQTTAQYRSSNSSAEWVEEAPSTRRTVVPLDQFGTVQFTNASAVENGKQVDLAQARASPITMAGPGHQALAVPSSIGSNGSSFKVTRT